MDTRIGSNTESGTCADAVLRTGYRLAFLLARVWWFIARPKHRAALVAVWFSNQILLVTQSYRNTLCLPGGGVAKREDALTAAIRELFEELRISLSPADLNLAHTYRATSEWRKSSIDVFEAYLNTCPTIVADRREITAAAFYPVETALLLSLDPIAAKYLCLRGQITAGEITSKASVVAPLKMAA